MLSTSQTHRVPAQAGIHVTKQGRPTGATSTVDARLREHDEGVRTRNDEQFKL